MNRSNFEQPEQGMRLRKIVCLLSGGADSATLVTYYKRAGFDVHCVSVNYGQKHSKELECAKKIVDFLGIEDHKILEFKQLKELLGKSVLISDNNVPEDHYTHENQKQTVVPNRNMILLAIASGYAITIGAESVAFAAHHNDYTIYPDCRPIFVAAFEMAVKQGNYENVNVVAPFIHMTKGEIVKLGITLGVPYELTWSCYNGKDKPCMKCGTDQERTLAFKFAGIKDPILTDEQWEKSLLICKEKDEHK